MKIVYSPQALNNLTEIADYLLPRSAQAANHVRADIRAAIETLAIFPNAGRLQSSNGIRKTITRNYRYVIYSMFNEDGKTVEILAIFHPAQLRIEPED